MTLNGQIKWDGEQAAFAVVEWSGGTDSLDDEYISGVSHAEVEQIATHEFAKPVSNHPIRV